MSWNKQNSNCLSPICSSIPLQKQTRLFIVKVLASFYHALEWKNEVIIAAPLINRWFCQSDNIQVAETNDFPVF